MLEDVFTNYAFRHPEAEFIRHNENMTYVVRDGNQKYLLRIHKAIDGLDLSHGSRNVQRNTLINSEIELLHQLHAADNIKTQYPILNKYGEYVTYLEGGVPATVLSWLDGEDLQKTAITDELAYTIGQTIGELHNAMSTLSCPNRYYYDEAFADAISDDIQEAYELKHITERNYRLMQDALSCIRTILVNERSQYVMIHADLSKSNLIHSHSEICPIDFSLSGYGLAEMDLSDINWTLHNEKLTPFLFAGYKSVTQHVINQSFIRAFTALYPIAYTASHHNKIDQEGKITQVVDRWCETILTPFIIAQ